jgi:hypothetical protein
VLTPLGYVIFVAGAGSGTLIALLLFIFAGSKLSAVMARRRKLVNMILGSVFTLLALSQVIRLFVK